MTYTATASDPGGSGGDVTAATSFSIAPTSGSGSSEGASCNGAICTAVTPGTYTVEGNDGDTSATAALTVSGPGVWAAPAGSGQAPLKAMSPTSFAIGEHDEHWRMLLTQPKKNPQVLFTGTVTLDRGSFSGVKGIKLEPGNGDSYSVQGGTITFHFTNRSYLDGLTWITPTASTTITFDLSVNGQPATADEIHLGPSGVAAASASPISVDRVPR